MAISNLLKDVYFFKTFTPVELQAVEKICERKKYYAHQTIFQKGDAAPAMFLVELGTVKLTRGDEEVATAGKGGMFGEMPFLDGGDRSATAVTIEESHLIEITYKKLTEFLLHNSETALKFYMVFARYVSKRLRTTLES